MATVINNPTPQSESGGNGFLIGVIVLIGFVVIFLYYGLPAIQRMGPVQVNVPAPQINVPAPQVNIPAPEVAVPAK